MTDRKTFEAALTLLELQKGDMARTKLRPKAPGPHPSRKPSTSSTTTNANHITAPNTILKNSRLENPEDPKTPRESTGNTEVQPGPYPTPISSTQQPSKGQAKVQLKDDSNVKLLVKYGRWSPSGRSWFANRRSVPGDRPPPRGASYSYRPLYSKQQPRSPTPQPRQSSVVSSTESQPIVMRPKMRRRLSQRSQAPAQQTAEVTLNTANEAEESDGSSDDPDPVIIRRRHRLRLSPTRKSRSPITVGEYLNRQKNRASDSDSPFRETSLASDLYEGVQDRVRRRDENLRRSRRLNPRSFREGSATPPIAARTRRSKASAVGGF